MSYTKKNKTVKEVSETKEEKTPVEDVVETETEQSSKPVSRAKSTRKKTTTKVEKSTPVATEVTTTEDKVESVETETVDDAVVKSSTEVIEEDTTKEVVMNEKEASDKKEEDNAKKSVGILAKLKETWAIWFALVVGILLLIVMICNPDSPKAKMTETEQLVYDSVMKLDELPSYLVTSYIINPSGNSGFVINKTAAGTSVFNLDTEDAYQIIDPATVGDHLILNDIIYNDTMYLAQPNYNDSQVIDGYTFYSLPESYKDESLNRNYLYLRDIFKHISGLTKTSVEVVDLGEGDTALTIYEGTLPAEQMKQIMGLGSVSFYTSLKESYSDYAGVSKLMNWFIEDTNEVLACSDAKVVIGIDSDGYARYARFTTGGICNKFYVTLCVLKDNSALPTVDYETVSVSALPYIETIADFAEFVSGYDSLDDAYKDMKNYNDTYDAIEQSVNDGTLVENGIPKDEAEQIIAETEGTNTTEGTDTTEGTNTTEGD